MNSPTFWLWVRHAVCVFVSLYMIVPLVIVTIISFSSAQFLTFPPPGFSMQWYDSFLSNPLWLNSLLTSFQIMVPSAIASTILGTAAAIGLSRMRSSWAMVLKGILMAPLVVPVIITAAAIFGVFRGWGLYGTLTGLVLAHSILSIPFVLSTVSAALELVDVRLEDAAANLGAKPFTAFRLVTLPLIMPAVLSGLLFAMVISFDELVVSLFLATPTVKPVTVQMWSNIRGDTDPTIAAIATALVLFTLGILLLESLIKRGSDSDTPIH